MRAMPPTRPRVDTAPSRLRIVRAARDQRRRVQPVRRRPPIPVGPGRPADGHAEEIPVGARVVNEFPIQLAKVQRPSLRDETLERPRLLDWLRAKSHGRVVLLIGRRRLRQDDPPRRLRATVRSRTLWYRLDDGRPRLDVGPAPPGGCRRVSTMRPSRPRRRRCWRAIGIDGPQRDVVLDTFIRELPGIVREGHGPHPR